MNSIFYPVKPSKKIKSRVNATLCKLMSEMFLHNSIVYSFDNEIVMYDGDDLEVRVAFTSTKEDILVTCTATSGVNVSFAIPKHIPSEHFAEELVEAIYDTYYN